MTQIFADGFNHYGTGAPSAANMGEGPYAVVAGPGCGIPPWGARTGQYSFATGPQDDNSGGATRIALGSSPGAIVVSMGFSVSALPQNNNFSIISLRDGSNNRLANLRLRTDGVLIFETPVGTAQGLTAGPVIKGQNWHALEMKFDLAGGAFELNVDQATVINISSISYVDDGSQGGSRTAHTTVQQVCIGAGVAVSPSMNPWFADLIIRNTAGTWNNGFEGDIRVATLFPNQDAAAQGWTARAREKIGTGILDNRNVGALVYAATSTGTDLGSGDFTIEGFYRFFAVPTGAYKAVLFGKWDEGGNARSYQLYLGGPSLDAGYLTFRTSTNGQAGTVAKKLSWPWLPALNRWYHVAVVRASGEDLLFIDGIQQGLPVADTDTYFAGNAYTSIGGQWEQSGAGSVGNTYFDGFQDEFRLSVGYARYTTSFTPTAVAFPRNIGGDPNFASVAWLSGWDNSIADESSYGRTLSAQNGSVLNTPDDGVYHYQDINQPTPRDDTLIEAALIAATSIYTQTPALPSDGETATVGTYTGPHTAVYRFKNTMSAAFDVKIGVDIPTTLANLMNAINAGPGSGTAYYAGTTANIDVTASQLPSNQMLVTANTPGSAGNSIATSTTAADGSWTSTVLAGGANIPGYSEFNFQRPPVNTTIVKAVTVVTRSFKSDSGTGTTQASFVGALGGVENGAANPLTLSPNYYLDTFETDPDTAGALSPTTIIGGRVRINRTA